MMTIPVNFPYDPYCRANSRLLLTKDEESGDLFLGVTPDGTSFGRDMLSKISLWSGDKEIAYTCKAADNRVYIESECGKAALAIAMPNELIIEAEGVSVMLGNGKAAGLFMGGGSAVDDASEGALYVTSGVRLRAIARKGHTEVRSAWDLDALSDPNPQVFIHPDKSGELKAVVFESDFDQPIVDDGTTVEMAAEDIGKEFESFLHTLIKYPDNDAALHAAYIIWTDLQPARILNQQCITTPEYISNRKTNGMAGLSDNVLMAAFIKDETAAVERLCSFLKYMCTDGVVPRFANNRTFVLQSQAPMFGVVLAARPELIKSISAENYQGLKKAFDWWKNERYCDERKLFYYLHRFEPGCSAMLPFADAAPEFAPDLNAYIVLWADALAQCADNLGKSDDAAYFAALSAATVGAMNALLWNGSEYIFKNIEDKQVCENHPGKYMVNLLGERVNAVKISEKLPTSYTLPLILNKKEIFNLGIEEIHNFKQALAVLAQNI